jgi:hypothetical protein
MLAYRQLFLLKEEYIPGPYQLFKVQKPISSQLFLYLPLTNPLLVEADGDQYWVSLK